MLFDMLAMKILLFHGGGTYLVAGFVHEWQRDALQGGSTLCHAKLSVDALRELALHARLFASVTRRARGQRGLGTSGSALAYFGRSLM